MKGKVLIKAPGELYSPTTEGVLVSADGVRDYRLNKNQEQINQEFEELINNYSGGTSNLQTDNYDITETENHYLRFANRIFNSNIQFGYVYWTPVKKYNIPYFVNLISDEIEVIEGAPSPIILLTGVYYSKSAKRFVAQSKRNNTITYYTEWEAFNSNDEKYQFDSSSVYNAIDLETDSLYYIDENTVCKIRWDDDEHITILVERNPSTQLLINAIPYEQLGTIGFNAINVIRHRYNLQGRTIDFSSTDDYFILKFEGGSFYNGTVIGSNKVYLDLDGIAPTQDWSVFEGNFANYGTSYPTNPHIGQTFFNTNLKKLLVWDGNRWIDSNGKLPIQNSGTTLPTGLTNSDKGTIFYKENDGLYYWNGSDWKSVGQSGIIKVDELPESGKENIIYFNTSDGIAYVWDDNEWKPLSTPEEIHKGTSAERPTDLTSEDEGYMYYDTTLHKPIFWNGEQWIDANGNTPANKRGTVLELPTNLTERDLGYTFYNTDDEVLLYYVQDSKGNDLWLDSLQKDNYNYTGNNYGIIEFEKFLDDDLIIYEFGQGTGKEYYELQQNTVNPVNEELTFKIYAHKNNPYFVAILDSDWETIGTGTIFKPVKHELFCNWLEAPGVQSRIWYEKTFGVTTAADVPYTTPYYKDKSTGIIYRYNKNLHRFEPVISTLTTRGTTLERPKNLPVSASGVFKYFDTTVNKNLTYRQDSAGNDLWFDDQNNNYSIIEIYGIISDVDKDYKIGIVDESNSASIGDVSEGNMWLQDTTLTTDPKYLYFVDMRNYINYNSLFIACNSEITELVLQNIAQHQLKVYNKWKGSDVNHIVDSEYVQDEFTIDTSYNPQISHTSIFHCISDDKYYQYIGQNLVEINL